MQSSTTATVFCPDCGTQNEDYLQRCTACDQLLDPEAAEESAKAPARPLHVRTLSIMAGLTFVALLVLQLAGQTFSMKVISAPVTGDAAAPVLETLVAEGEVTQAQAGRLLLELYINDELQARLDAGELSGEEQVAALERVRDREQAVVLGFGGFLGLLWPLLAFAGAALVTAVVTRARRHTEIVVGAAIAAAIQLGVWLFGVGFDVGAVLGGQLLMVDGKLAFAAAPVMLLGMTLFMSVLASAVVAALTYLGVQQLTGLAVCAHCDHAVSFRPHAPSACPKCHVPLRLGRKLRYSGGDAFLGELGRAAAPVTRASTGAAELLCLRCAKAYEADACPVHPYEPLVDPSREDVKLRLLDLDAQAGTQRYVKWTDGGLGIDAALAVPAPTGPQLCMACAKTYEADACPVHPHEPLLDPTREEVRLQLVEADDRARTQMSTRLMFAGAGVAVALTAALAVTLELEMSVLGGVFIGTLASLVAVATVITPKLAPPRYSRWSGEGAVDLDEFGMGAQATFWTPLRAFVMRAKQQALVMLAVVAVGAGVGAGLGVATGTTVAGLAILGAVTTLIGHAAWIWMSDTAKDVRKAASDAREAWNDPYAS